MSGHSNKKIKSHIESSKELEKKMGELTDQLQESLTRSFKETLGVDIPSAMEADVRQTDIIMVYSTDPKVDEYINGARKILNASFGVSEVSIINPILDTVETVVNKIIGGADLQVGLHSTSVKVRQHIAVCYSAVQVALAKDWRTSTDFYVSYYAFVVWPLPITRAPSDLMLANVSESPSENYRYAPLDL